MTNDPKIFPNQDPPQSGCPPLCTPAPAPPLDAAIVPVEIRSCARRMSGPTAPAVPATPPAGSADPAPRESINSASLHPVSESPSASPVSACRSLAAVPPDASASSSSGIRVFHRLLSHRSLVPLCLPPPASTPPSCSPVHISPPLTARSFLRFQALVPQCAVRPFRRCSELHSSYPP